MNGKKTKNPNSKEPAQNSACLCQGFGPALSELLRRFGPPEETRRHFAAARLEVLRGLRALLDARIEQITRAQHPDKGEKIAVE